MKKGRQVQTFLYLYAITRKHYQKDYQLMEQ